MFKGFWRLEHRRDGQVIGVQHVRNTITDTGLAAIFDTFFRHGTTSPAWYMGLIGPGTTVDASDTLASHAGWTEYNQTRASWAPTATTARVLEGTGSFTVTTAGTVSGFFLTDKISGASGTLWCAALMDDRTVAVGDVLSLKYQVTG